MLIKVMYQNDTYDMVKPFMLDELIAHARIKKFLRASGWVEIGLDPIRGIGGGAYLGKERREEIASAPEALRSTVFV